MASPVTVEERDLRLLSRLRQLENLGHYLEWKPKHTQYIMPIYENSYDTIIQIEKDSTRSSSLTSYSRRGHLWDQTNLPRNLSSQILKIFYLYPLFLILPPCSIQSGSSSQKQPHSMGRLLLIPSKPSLHQINPFNQPLLTGLVLQLTSHSGTPPRRCHLLTFFCIGQTKAGQSILHVAEQVRSWRRQSLHKPLCCQNAPLLHVQLAAHQVPKPFCTKLLPIQSDPNLYPS